MNGVKRVIVFCILIVILPATLIIIPLYLRHTVFADVIYKVAESDILEIRDGISSIFCQQHTLRMDTNFNAFQLASKPEISTNRKHIRLKKSMVLPDDTLEYWGFYLLKGAIVQLKFCSRYEGSRILVVKGERNLKTCGLLEHNKNKVGTNFAQGHEKVKVTFEDKEEFNMSKEKNHNNDSELEKDFGKNSEEKLKLKTVENNNIEKYEYDNDELLLLDDNHGGEDFSSSEIQNTKILNNNNSNDKILLKNSIEKLQNTIDDSNNSNKSKYTLKTENVINNNENRTEIKLNQKNLTEIDGMQIINRNIQSNVDDNDDDNIRKRNRHIKKYSGQNLDNIDIINSNSTNTKRRHRRHYNHNNKNDMNGKYNDKKQKIMNELYLKQRRQKRDQIYDRKISHGGNAFNFTEKDESNSISSFENSLLSCYDGNILLAEGFPPSSQCTNVHFLSNNGSHMSSKHEVVEDGYYYYIFYSDNDLVRNDIHAIFDIYKPTFQYSNITKPNKQQHQSVSANNNDSYQNQNYIVESAHPQFCINSTNCTFPLNFYSNEYVIVEIPTRDGIEHDEDDISYLISTCHPRMSIYVIFPILVLVLILSCSFL